MQKRKPGVDDLLAGNLRKLAQGQNGAQLPENKGIALQEQVLCAHERFLLQNHHVVDGRKRSIKQVFESRVIGRGSALAATVLATQTTKLNLAGLVTSTLLIRIRIHRFSRERRGHHNYGQLQAPEAKEAIAYPDDKLEKMIKLLQGSAEVLCKFRVGC